MPAWLVSALKTVVPHLGSIISAAAPVFTKKKDEAAANLLQQQIGELQAAVTQNAVHIKELAAQLQSTVTTLEEAASIADARLRRALALCIVAIVFSVIALGATLALVAR
jgi:hypothetical protein